MPDPAPENFDTIPQTEAMESGATETHEAATLPGDFTPTIATGLPPGLVDHPRYEILQYLGGGGMGAVYKALHRVMDRVVALKVINPAYISRADAVARFEQEVRAAARLSHPNIVTAYDAEQAGDAHFLVMEYVDGVNLAHVLSQAKRDRQAGLRSSEPGAPAGKPGEEETIHVGLPVAQACDYVRQAALGLQHAFERGMVHRDIKPLNLMRDCSGCVKILDFGLARFASESERPTNLTAEGTVLGTPDYMAPEQAQNSRSADIRADIYSLGCTLYHVLTGSAPYPEGSTFAKMMSHVEAAPKPVKEFRDDLPAELARIVARMMAKDPASRYQTPKEVADALEPFAKASGSESKANSPRKAKMARGLALAVLLALAAGAAYMAHALWNKQPSPSLSDHQEEAVRAKESAVDKENLLWPVQAIQEGRIAAPDLSRAKVLFDKVNFDDLPPGTFSGARPKVGTAAKGTQGKSAARPLRRWKVPGDHYSNFACRVIGRWQELRSGDRYGISISNPARKRSLFIALDGDPLLFLIELEAQELGGHRQGLGSLRHRAIKPGRAENALLIVVHEQIARIYVNGVAVSQPVRLEWELTPAELLLTTAGPAPEVEFKRVTVWSLDGVKE
jgi:serine/threonine protein kinase